MEMSEREICQSYRLAKDRNEQITVLAELNLVTKAKIKKILIENGEIKRKVIDYSSDSSDLIQSQRKVIKKYSYMKEDDLYQRLSYHLTLCTAILQAIESQKIVRKPEDFRKDGSTTKLYPVESHYIYVDPRDEADRNKFLESFVDLCHSRQVV